MIFIDEIQTSPAAIKALRYFYEQKPGLHIITAGSLLDHTLNEIKYSMPVGRIEFAYMYPLTFYEFLHSIEESGLVEIINNYTLQDTFGEAIHYKINELLRIYFFIGGMPEAVDNYINKKNLAEIEKIHAGILTSIEYDFAKYGTRKQQEYLKDVLHYAANNIGHKVKYSNVNKSANSKLLKGAFLKLVMSRIIHLVISTKSTDIPITRLQNNDIFPVEIKAGKRGTLKSLHVFLAEKNKETGIRFNLDLPSYGKNLTAPLNLPEKKQIKIILFSRLYFCCVALHAYCRILWK